MWAYEGWGTRMHTTLITIALLSVMPVLSGCKRQGSGEAREGGIAGASGGDGTASGGTSGTGGTSGVAGTEAGLGGADSHAQPIPDGPPRDGLAMPNLDQLDCNQLGAAASNYQNLAS